MPIHFAPQLIIPSGTKDISFYVRALGAVERQRWSNEDGSVHVAEFTIGEAVFHLHEMNETKKQMAPGREGPVSAIIGLFVPDVDALVEQAVRAGAQLIMPPTTFDYDYRQAEIRDPFGHLWLIEKKTDS